jgi:FKBP-type peptidyl-prolyl cis-trans isomerase FklB
MKIRKILAVAFVATAMISCTNQPKQVTSLENEIDSVSYAIGITMSQQLKGSFEEVNEDVLLQAIRNGLDSTNLLIDIKDNQAIIRPYFQKKQQEAFKKQQEEAEKKALVEYADNKKAGEDFIEANKTKKDVQVTPSGLQYIVLKEGTGAKPTLQNKVKVHYHGTTIDGKVFDSSVDRGQPTEFFVNQVIKGWQEGLQMMKVGAKYKFFIPQDLSYGSVKKSELILPFSALVFEVELLDIVQ